MCFNTSLASLSSFVHTLFLVAIMLFFLLYELGQLLRKRPGDVFGRSMAGNHIMSDEDDIFSRMGTSKISRKYHQGLSSSDAEIDYRRGRSLREGKGDFAWHD